MTSSPANIARSLGLQKRSAPIMKRCAQRGLARQDSWLNARSANLGVVNNKGTKSKHINRCTGGNANHRYNCPTCAGTFARPRQKELHLSNGCPGLHPGAVTFFDTISCDRCWKEFETLTEYRKHEERQHPENEKDAFKCKLCGRDFPTKHFRDDLACRLRSPCQLGLAS